MQDSNPRINRRDYSLPPDRPQGEQAMPLHHPVVEPIVHPPQATAQPEPTPPPVQPAPQRTAEPNLPPPPQPLPDANVSYLAATSNELHVEPGYQMPTPQLNDRKTQSKRSRKLPKLSRRAAMAIAAVAVIGIGALVVQKIAFGHKSSANNGGVSIRGQATQASSSTPNAGLPVVTLNDYKYDPQTKTGAYTDKVGVVSLAVSEQAQPAMYKVLDAAFLKRAADGFGTNKPIIINNGAAYVAESDNGKGQTAVFARGRLLVVAKAKFIIDTTFWQEFINQFKPATSSQ